MRRCRIVLCLLLASAVGHAEPPEPGFRYFLAGDPADVTPPTRGLIVLQGGGTDVDENYRAMGRAAGHGDFVVLRASGGDAYNHYVRELCRCDSVETLVFESREAAYDEFVLRKIRGAEALFIAGGDQSRYVRFWRGTPVEDAIHEVAAKPAPVGGTSAGMAILGEFVYAAMSDASLDSADALADPYHEDVTLERDFLHLPGLRGILTDQHWIERDRMGRTLAMLGRILADGWASTARAIAADRKTALHVDPASGVGTVFASAGHDTPWVYLLEANGPAPGVRRGEPLTLDSVRVTRLAPGDNVDLRRWLGEPGVRYTLSASDGRIRSSRASPY